MDYYIGIDPASASFTAAISHKGQIAGWPVTFDNSAEGLGEMLGWATAQGARPSTTCLCIENTGVYSELLLYLIHEAGWESALLDPGKLHPRKQRPKTDEIDSLKIVDYAWRYRDTLIPWRPKEAIAEQIQVLLTTREQLVRQRTALKGARSTLKRKYIQTPTANEVVEDLVVIIAGKIDQLEQEIGRLIKSSPTLAQTVALLTSAPGVGFLLAAHLLAITDGFTRPFAYRSLARHLGIAPLPFESGASVRRAPKSRGKGPRMLRKLLHLAARSVVTHKPEFRAYYARKVAQGKPKKVVLNNVANRLLRIVCSMLKNRQPYIEGYVSVNPRLLSS